MTTSGSTATLFDPDRARGKIWGGDWVDGSEQLEVREPATGDLLAELAAAGPADVERAAAGAAAAQPAWAATAPDERAAVLSRAADLLEEHHDEYQGWLIREAGSAAPKAEFETMKLVLGELRVAAGLASEKLEHELDDPMGRRSVMRRVPIGVVGVISPFNFPGVLSMRSVAPALALGNAVVLKPDAQTPISGGHFLAQLLHRAGLPAGLLHVVPGGAEAGQAICTAPEIGMISFTGSTPVGRKVGALAGEHLKRVVLELGGNNAFIVLDDVSADDASSAGAWGSFLHQGQICMSSGRHIVHESLAGDYVAALAERARRLPVGDPNGGEVALGPLINERQVEHVDGLVRESREAGATIEAGGDPDSPFYPATVVSGVKPDMRLWREEIFGPVAPIMTFATEEEAIELANDTEYGLSAGIYTSDPERGRAIAERLHTGLVHIGDQTVNDLPMVPFGGSRASGHGRFGGPANLEAFTEWRWITERDEPATYPF